MYRGPLSASGQDREEHSQGQGKGGSRASEWQNGAIFGERAESRGPVCGPAHSRALHKRRVCLEEVEERSGGQADWLVHRMAQRRDSSSAKPSFRQNTGRG